MRSQSYQRRRSLVLLASVACLLCLLTLLRIQAGDNDGDSAVHSRLSVQKTEDGVQRVLCDGRAVLEIATTKDGSMKTWTPGSITIVERQYDRPRQQVLFVLDGDGLIGRLVTDGTGYRVDTTEAPVVGIDASAAEALVSTAARGVEDTLKELLRGSNLLFAVSNVLLESSAASTTNRGSRVSPEWR